MVSQCLWARHDQASVSGAPTAAPGVLAGDESQLRFDWGRGHLQAHMAAGSRQDLRPQCLLSATPCRGRPSQAASCSPKASKGGSASKTGIRSVHSMVTQVTRHLCCILLGNRHHGYEIQTQEAGKGPNCQNKNLSGGTEI